MSRRLRRRALRSLTASLTLGTALLSGCRADPPALPARGELQEELARLLESQGGWPPPEPRRPALEQQLLARTRAVLAQEARRVTPIASRELAEHLPDLRALGARQVTTEQHHDYRGFRYTVVRRSFRAGVHQAELLIVDSGGSPDLLAPFELLVMAARTGADTSTRAGTWQGVRWVERLDRELERRHAAVLLGDRVLVEASGPAQVGRGPYRRLLAAVDLAGLGARLAAPVG